MSADYFVQQTTLFFELNRARRRSAEALAAASIVMGEVAQRRTQLVIAVDTLAQAVDTVIAARESLDEACDLVEEAARLAGPAVDAMHAASIAFADFPPRAETRNHAMANSTTKGQAA